LECNVVWEMDTSHSEESASFISKVEMSHLRLKQLVSPDFDVVWHHIPYHMLQNNVCSLLKSYSTWWIMSLTYSCKPVISYNKIIGTFLLLPTWYTNFLFIHTNYIKLNSATCFERNPIIIRRSASQIVHMQPLVSSLSASDHLVQPLRKESFLSGCTRRSLAECDDTRGCICTICAFDLLMMSRLRSKHVEEFNWM
jgi:hypothetical protein